MNRRRLATILSALLTTGCAGTLQRDLAWEVKPHLHVQHGMQQAGAQYRLGRYFQGQGRQVLAEKAYRQAVAADPTHVGAINALAALLAARGDFEEASRWFEKLVARAPEQAYLRNNAGYALFLQHRYAEAVKELRTAVVLDPSFERAWINLAQAARAAGRSDIAALAAERRVEADVPTIAAPLPPETVDASKHAGKADLSLALSRGLSAQAASGPPMLAKSEPESQPVPSTELPPREAETAKTPATALVGLRELPFRRLDTDQLAVGAQAGEAGNDVEAARQVAMRPPVLLTRVGLSAPADISKTRLEVTNGNGVRHFAGQVAGKLRSQGLDVRRITNYDSFGVERSRIEYRPGFEAEARALARRMGLDAVIVELEQARWNSDVRVVLGADARRGALLET